jgi:hypothetical protein
MIARPRGMQALLEKQIHGLLTYPSAGWPGAKTVRMHAPTSTGVTADLKQRVRRGSAAGRCAMNRERDESSCMLSTASHRAAQKKAS